jgi:hypothetical protein
MVQLLTSYMKNFKFSLKWPFIIRDDSLCQCGRYKKCVRKVNVSSSGRVWIDSEDHFSCGKIINQVEKLNKWWYLKNKR